jgi:hypothetical protein
MFKFSVEGSEQASGDGSLDSFGGGVPQPIEFRARGAVVFILGTITSCRNGQNAMRHVGIWLAESDQPDMQRPLSFIDPRARVCGCG